MRGSVSVLVVGLLASLLAAPQAPPRAQRGPPLPRTGALFGAFVAVDPHTGNTRRQAMANLEAEVGRQMAVDRVYYGWDTEFLTDPADYADRDAGRIIAVSWGIRTKAGAYVKWRDIAGGIYDQEIDAHARAITDFGAPLFFIFNHEPERFRDGGGEPDAGTSADFVAAYKHIHDRFEEDGATNVSYILDLLACTYSASCGGETPEPPEHYYAGDSYVDLVAADGYNFYGCRGDTWKEFGDVFDDFYAYGLKKSKPLMLAEWGSTEDFQDRSRKADWIGQASAAVMAMPQIKVLTYFDGGQVCTTLWVDSTPRALTAFQAMALDPYFNPS